jgi:hypothetical protein
MLMDWPMLWGGMRLETVETRQGGEETRDGKGAVERADDGLMRSAVEAFWKAGKVLGVTCHALGKQMLLGARGPMKHGIRG